MKKASWFIIFLFLALATLFLLLPSCSDNSVKVLVENISLGGTGDNYIVTPAKIEATRIKLNSVVKIPITITNSDSQPKTFQLKVVSPLSGETSAGYTPYPVNGIDTFFNQDTEYVDNVWLNQGIITIEGGKKGIVNFYIAKVDEIPNTQVWVNVSVETSQQITSAYIVNILIKGDKK